MTRDQAIADRARQMLPMYREPYLRTTTGKASPRAAIKAHCLECMGWVRAEIPVCTSTACPLYAYRPYRSKGASLDA